jgi:hypothetical protein
VAGAVAGAGRLGAAVCDQGEFTGGDEGEELAAQRDVGAVDADHVGALPWGGDRNLSTKWVHNKSGSAAV